MALNSCLSCHHAHSVTPGIPRFGRAEEWMPLAEKGKKTLVDHAYYGYKNPNGGVMPPRGGDATLDYDDVEAAVVYIVNHSGGKI